MVAKAEADLDSEVTEEEMDWEGVDSVDLAAAASEVMEEGLAEVVDSEEDSVEVEDLEVEEADSEVDSVEDAEPEHSIRLHRTHASLAAH